jgi:hypothetical protein
MSNGSRNIPPYEPNRWAGVWVGAGLFAVFIAIGVIGNLMPSLLPSLLPPAGSQTHGMTDAERDTAAICNSALSDDATFPAYHYAKQAVLEELKAPATAKFPDWGDPGITYSRSADCKFTVKGYVDAQNGYGGFLRGRYEVVVQFRGKDGWWIYPAVIYQ